MAAAAALPGDELVHLHVLPEPGSALACTGDGRLQLLSLQVGNVTFLAHELHDSCTWHMCGQLWAVDRLLVPLPRLHM